ncbi:Zinc finger protein [Hondaea fermentalgiana]|uniref:Zinc finger protein n=1 Tax=Hondaea fermentalgiana TaxID=2315210 RepID=A0A2R5GNS4_9STRA|nr:Zinc finger protein [Hondaea fermentalgiana]|eukprot:GBG32546.1 Zinc finger protein [Hondaea fermentalgiana]
MVVRNPAAFDIMPLDQLGSEMKNHHELFDMSTTDFGNEDTEMDLFPEQHDASNPMMMEFEGSEMLSIPEQEQLCQQITKLSGESLMALQALIKKEDPRSLRYENAQWEFDTSTMRPDMVRKIRDFVDDAMDEEVLALTSTPSWSLSATLPEPAPVPQPFYHKMGRGAARKEQDATSAAIPAQLDAGSQQPQFSQATEATEPEQHRPRPRARTQSSLTEAMQESPMIHPSHYPEYSQSPRVSSSFDATDLSRDQNKKVLNAEAASRPSAPASTSTRPVKPKRMRAASGPALSRGELLETMSDIKIFRPLETPGKKKDIRFMCDACGKGFRKRSEVVVHVRVHTGERPLKCSMCDRCFAHPSNLRAHERKHPEANKFSCTVAGCGETFTDQARLKSHMMAHQKAVFACAHCGKHFRTQQRLQSHEAQYHMG